MFETESFIDIKPHTGEVINILKKHPRWLVRARKSAIASIAWKMQQAIKEQYQTQSGWPAPVKRGKQGMSWFSRFVRYRIIAGRRMIMLPAKDQWNRGAAKYVKRDSAWLKIATKRHEYGKTLRVTKKMRKKMAAMGMPLRKSTKKITIPARVAYHKIWQQFEPKIPTMFEAKFLDSLRRYESGMSKFEWDTMKDIIG